VSKYDYLVVGAGMFGATFAYYARCSGKRVLVVEARDHIGGNCHSSDVNGIQVHAYGPHVFHTSDQRLWDFIRKFAPFSSYVHKVRARVSDRFISLPINMATMHQVWGVTTPKEAQQKLIEQRIPCDKPRNLEEWILSQVGPDLYELLIYNYVSKQWGRPPNTLPATIIKRLPIRMTWNDNYFNDPFQGIPIGGYDQIFERMLDGNEVKLGVDFLKERASLSKIADHIVYSGQIDAYYDYALGAMQYRTLSFETKIIDESDFQGMSHISYPSQSIPYTRTVEHKHFEPDAKPCSKTVVTWETPHEWRRGDFPFYPINDELNNDLYERYRQISLKDSSITFGGRTGSYKYYDIHQVMAQAISVAKNRGLCT